VILDRIRLKEELKKRAEGRGGEAHKKNWSNTRMSRQDPFYSVKDKIVTNLTKFRDDFQRFESLSTRSTDYATLSASLKSTLSAIEADVKDLNQTIAIVESNRARFTQISNEELESRRAFVNETKSTLASYKNSRLLSAQAVHRDLVSNVGHQNSRFTRAIDYQTNREGDDYVNSSASQQQTLIKQQDSVLDSMDDALKRLSDISVDINSSLEEQQQMLTETDESLDSAQLNMNFVLKKMDKLLKTSDRGRICCVIGLFFLAIILVIIIVYV